MAWRYRDLRFVALAGLLGLLLVPPLRALLWGADPARPTLFGVPDLWGLLISVFAIVAVFLLDWLVAGQRVATAELQRSHHMLELVMNTIPQRLKWKDRNFRYIGCNRAAAQDAGLASPEEIVGKDDFDLAWKRSARLYREDDRIVFTENRSKVNYEEPQVRDDGSTLWLRTTKVPLRDEGGNVIGVFSSYEDITEAKKAGEELRRSEASYRTLVEQASDGIFVADAHGNFLDVNPSGCAMIGYTQEELLGMNMGELIPPADLAENPLRIPELRAGQRIIHERSLIRKDGSLLPVEISAKMLPDGLFQGIARDVSDRKRAEEERRNLESQLRQSQKMEVVGQLAGGVAHDFNNVLTAIQGNTEFLLRDRHAPERWRADLEEIRKATKRGAALTQQLLAFSRRQVLIPKTLDLNIVVGDMERMLRRLIGADVELVVDLEAGVGLVRADPGQVEQVIMNLVVNARDAMPEGGRLLIRTHNVEFDDEFVEAHPDAEVGSYVALTVRDTGLGMEEDTLERAFEPFFTTKGPGEGTGLGLSMVYGIVKQSGGHVSLSSEPGCGTDCTVYLPRSERAAEPRVDRTAGPCALKGSETVLLVEDEPQVRVLTERVLGSQGYRVLCAGDPDLALDIARKHDGAIDALVAGLVLPRMSGRELAETVRRARPEIRVLFVSGYTHETVFDGGAIEEQSAFLEKPFSVDSLLRKLREVLDAPRVGAPRA